MTTTEQPSVSVRPTLTSLRRARELFLLGRQVPDDVPEEVVAAWKRARFFGVRHDTRDPVPAPAPPPVRPEGSALLAAARPVLERIAPTLGAEQAALLLTDERLRVLWATGGGRDDLYRFDLSEQTVGVNSAARALSTRRRAEVHGPEHFLDLWQDVSAVSVPVLAPDTGRPLGTVTVASTLCAEGGPHPGAALAEAAADAVEAELLARSQGAERVLLDAYLAAVRGAGRHARDGDGEAGRERGGRGRPEAERAVVALDGRSRLVSEAAGRLLSPEGLEALERGALAAVGGAPLTAVPLPEGARCRATLAPVTHLGSVIGVVAVLEPVGRTAAGVDSWGGAAAIAHSGGGGGVDVGVAGRSVAWRHAVDRATELARSSSEPLLLVGERGTGKASLARELATELAGELPGRVGGEPLLTADAAEGEVHAALDAWAGGRAVLVRHAERLTQRDVAALNSLLEAPPVAPLLVTYTPGPPPGACLERLLDSLAARSVTLPALRERPEDIKDLLDSLTPRPAPGDPPLTWSLDALRALEQHPWPGNVTELVHLVRALTEQRRATGPVRRAELPDPVREGPAARQLSPMEQAERAAILDALHRHGGNKARTAVALGIARATLYRKLRGYRG
ncbi:helix-turn-helix domain-containing protein [Streptomyces neyagawaensis]|uniref:helix-turn-helix domain-containing protein n=2 Tax=Streptomyces neyagawaensis TaxID=42238 RepID=UPI00201CBA54|nr:helix-turn-helix domain-containing protein [Streptomyces neyagawaensis]MCL6737942.1 regulator [Streptomyces neyagawaensis]MDE1687773.1 helix-turn-helix domain-containing protein [Streptomyces neyagawaensis]